MNASKGEFVRMCMEVELAKPLFSKFRSRHRIKRIEDEAMHQVQQGVQEGRVANQVVACSREGTKNGKKSTVVPKLGASGGASGVGVDKGSGRDKVDSVVVGSRPNRRCLCRRSFLPPTRVLDSQVSLSMRSRNAAVVGAHTIVVVKKLGVGMVACCNVKDNVPLQDPGEGSCRFNGDDVFTDDMNIDPLLPISGVRGNIATPEEMTSTGSDVITKHNGIGNVLKVPVNSFPALTVEDVRMLSSPFHAVEGEVEEDDDPKCPIIWITKRFTNEMENDHVLFGKPWMEDVLGSDPVDENVVIKPVVDVGLAGVLNLGLLLPSSPHGRVANDKPNKRSSLQSQNGWPFTVNVNKARPKLPTMTADPIGDVSTVNLSSLPTHVLDSQVSLSMHSRNAAAVGAHTIVVVRKLSVGVVVRKLSVGMVTCCNVKDNVTL
ncbi:hypothetical protein GH714_018260 [Hevea brasiliensis]|uniref:Uncharacterized protein n=1 Tax=Hevea brasiliensis TaxID=3981 RepID=A0A6A6MFY2_HEVBR|nr:hypothetical protein GH714_018260 [Hevea brasiliensis]